MAGRAAGRAPPRDVRRRGALARRARRRPLRRVVLRRPASTTSVWRTRGGWWRSTSRASRCWSPATRTAACTRRTTSAGTAARQLCPSRASPRRRRRLGIRCPYHSWTYALDGSPAAGAARRASRTPATFALHPVGVETWGGLRLRAPDAGGAPSRCPAQVAHAGATLANYGLGDLVTGQVLRYDVAANYKVLLENYNECYHCGPVHPELSRLVPSFAGGGSDLDWDHGIPHREGAWTFTMTGTTDRAPLAGLDEHERTRHKGDLVYPNLMLSASADHVAAFVLHPRAADRTEVVCSLLFARRGGRGPGVRPERRRRALAPGQPAGLGDLRVGAARHVVARLHARLVRADGGRQPRHPALAAAPPGGTPGDRPVS